MGRKRAGRLTPKAIWTCFWSSGIRLAGSREASMDRLSTRCENGRLAVYSRLYPGGMGKPKEKRVDVLSGRTRRSTHRINMAAEPITDHTITDHAATEIERRGLSVGTIDGILKGPEQRLEVRPGRVVLQSRLHEFGSTYLIGYL
jgi:hypothetical protein